MCPFGVSITSLASWPCWSGSVLSVTTGHKTFTFKTMLIPNFFDAILKLPLISIPLGANIFVVTDPDKLYFRSDIGSFYLWSVQPCTLARTL